MSPWTMVVRGILASVLGLILLIWPGATLLILMVFFPLFVVADGIAAIVMGCREDKWKLYSLRSMGVLEIIVGLIVLVWPGITITAFAILMGVWAFVVAAAEFYMSTRVMQLKPMTRTFYVLGALATIVIGVLIVVYPLVVAEILIWLMGLFFLVYGAVLFFGGYWAAGKLNGKKLL